jgi:predicted DNA-binding transcriptional regulator YafY
MAANQEYTGRIRTLRILRSIIEKPYFYTKKRLAEIYGMSEESIKDDLEAIKTAGFDLDWKSSNNKYFYGLATDRNFDNLRAFLVFNPKEEEMLNEVIRQISKENATGDRLLRKMNRIYDVSKMSTIDRTFLTKLDKLEKAKNDKKVVVLRDYHSTNSSTVKHRTVEAFHISAEDDILHAYDLDVQDIRHYKISRISKLDISQIDWRHEASHVLQATDPFRIHNNQQIKVHLRMKVGGYNSLLEAYPIARAYIRPAPDVIDQFDLECKVNAKFYGITNFILGYYDSITTIFEPDELIDHIKNAAQKLFDKKF